jgi:16S rRNA (cytosine967-C5)-methyltransferase
MAQLSARRAALTALRIWRTEKQFADSIISKIIGETDFAASDHAFALELFYGVLRNLTLLDFWIGCLRTSRVDAELRDILRLGFYQLFILSTPEHAAVYETVELAPKRGRPLINGILRTALRTGDELLSQANAQPLQVRTSHPEFLISHWEKNFGREATETLCAWNNRPPPVYGRINRLRIQPEQFLQTYPEPQPISHRSDFVTFNVHPHEALQRGHCYIQDPSTVLPCKLLDPQPGEKILDACAAPGGKTAYLAELMQNRGLIAACDRDPKRIDVLQENIARLDVRIVRTVCCDWVRDGVPSEIMSLGLFDRILLDAPCTNTGAMRRRVDVRWRLRPDDFGRMHQQQISILRVVVPLLKQGGILVYSTCSLEPEENEEVVEETLANASMLRLEQQKHCFPFRDSFDGAFAAQLTKEN